MNAAIGNTTTSRCDSLIYMLVYSETNDGLMRVQKIEKFVELNRQLPNNSFSQIVEWNVVILWNAFLRLSARR
jgi:hypothetical protein